MNYDLWNAALHRNTKQIVWGGIYKDMKDWNGNYNSIYKIIGASNHTDKERESNDYYATDPIAIDKLLTVEQLPKNVWECAAGECHLANRLRELGHNVFTTDIIQRGVDSIQDFLAATELPIKDCCILTNPPYKYAKEFVLKALDLLPDGGRCYMFLKLTFLEGKSRYSEIFSLKPPIKVLVFSQRIICAMNGEFDKYPSSAIAYAWFVWEKGYTGDTIIKWL